MALSFKELKNKKRPKVLAVVVEPAERDAVAALLANAELDAQVVGDAAGAYWALKRFPANLVLADDLTQTQCKELSRLLSDDPLTRGVPLVVMSRPFEPAELVARVREALARAATDGG